MLGPAMGLCAYAFFSGMDLISKLLDGAYPTHLLIMVNAAIALCAFMLWSRKSHGIWLPKPMFFWRVAANGALSGIGMLAAFYGYRNMPTIADAYALGFSGPLFAVILAYFVLKENVGPKRWAAVAVGFSGVMLILQPDIMNLNAVALGPLISAFCFASASIVIRSMKTEMRPQAILIFTHITLIAVILPFAVFMEFIATPDPAETSRGLSLDLFALIAIAAIAYTIGQILIVGALARTDASLIAPMAFTQMFWGVVYGLLIWNTLPRATTILGVAVVIVATIYIVRDAKRAVVAPAPVPL